MVGPYEYTDLVRTIRVWSKYVFGLEHLYNNKCNSTNTKTTAETTITINMSRVHNVPYFL